MDSAKADSADFASPEQLRFTSKPTLPTLLILSSGPLMLMIGMAIHDIIELLEISKSIGESVIQVVGFASTIRYLGVSVAVFFSIAVIARVSGLIGEGRSEDAAQVIADIYRISFISMFFVLVILGFSTKPLLKFMGGDNKLAEDGLSFMKPILASLPFIALFQVSCGTLNAQGRSVLVAWCQLGGYILNVGVFGPILLFGFKVGIGLCGLSFALSQAVPGVILTILIFSGVFDIKPTLRMLFKPLSKETWMAVKLATPYMLTVITGCFPPMLTLRYMMSAAFDIGLGAECGTVYSIFLKIQVFMNSLTIGLNQGFLSCGSFSNGAKLSERHKGFFHNTAVLVVCSQLIFLPIIAGFPKLIPSIWTSDEETLNLAAKMIPIAFYSSWLYGLNEVFVNFLLSVERPTAALIPAVLRGVLFIVNSLIIHETDKKDPVRMMWVYVINDVMVVAITTFLISKSYKKMINSINSCPLLHTAE